MSWLSTTRAAELVGVSDRAIRLWAQSGRLESRPAPDGRGREVNTESLPRLQAAPITARAAALALVPVERRDQLLGAVARAYELLDQIRALPERSDRRHRPTPACAVLLAQLANAVPAELATHVVRPLGRGPIAYSAVEHLLRQRPASPLDLLRQGESQGRPALLPPDALLWLQAAKIDTNARYCATIYRRYVQAAPPRGWPLVSARTVRRALADLTDANPEFVKGRCGERTYQATAAPYVERDWTDHEVGELYCGDHHEFDVWVRDGARLFRPWVTGWQDVRSGLFVGWKICEQPNADTIAESFFHAVRPKLPGYERVCGLPGGVYEDNGSDYRAKRFEAPAGAFRALNLKIVHAREYNAKAKPIERAFRDVAGDFTPTLPGYCGNGPGFDSEKTRRELAEHKRFVEGKSKTTPILTLSEFTQRWEHWVLEYAQWPDRGLEQREERPITALALWNLRIADEAGKHRLREMEAEPLYYLLLKSDERTVQRGGVVVVDGVTYHHTSLPGRRGTRVRVALDPSRQGHAFVWADGRCVVATNAKLAGSVRGIAEVEREKRDLAKEHEQRAAERQALGPIDLMPPLLPAAAPVAPLPHVVRQFVFAAEQARAAERVDTKREEETRAIEERRSAYVRALGSGEQRDTHTDDDEDIERMRLENEMRRLG